jgi:hypothetical protein
LRQSQLFFVGYPKPQRGEADFTAEVFAAMSSTRAPDDSAEKASGTKAAAAKINTDKVSINITITTIITIIILRTTTTAVAGAGDGE